MIHQTADQYAPPGDEGNPEYWRAGCECARAGLCYRCRAAAEIEHLIKARNRDHEQAWQNGMECSRLRTEIERLRAVMYQACSDMGCYCADGEEVPHG